MTQGRRIVNQLQEVREKLAESTALRARYEELAASYQARIDRLEFVEQGGHLLRDPPVADFCPVCDSELDPAVEHDLPEPSPAEHEELMMRFADLQQTLRQMETDQEPLQLQQRQLQDEANRINQLIRGELQPELFPVICT